MTENNGKFNWPLLGNPQITDYLEKRIIKDQVGGTYIFNGPDNFGKTSLALNFAKILFCNELKNKKEIPCGTCHSCRQFNKNINEDEKNTIHGDFHLIKKEKDKKNISIEQVRAFIKDLSMSSFLGQYKVGIIKHAETLSQEASNALLKTLEEPKKDVVIILITNDFENLPSTIASRSQILNFYPVKADEIYDYLVREYKIPRSKAKHFSRLALGRPALALKFFEDSDFFEKYQKSVDAFLNIKKSNIHERISIVDDLLLGKKDDKENLRNAFRILEVWQGIMRDWIFIDFSHFNLIQHEIFLEKLEEAKKRYKLAEILKLANYFKEAKINLQANVNPKLVLENLVIKI
jgi:DNA polymerase-3 subunit delta'